jgi:hypothetical protein
VTRKLSASSEAEPGELIRVSADSIFKAPLSEQQKAVLKEFAGKQATEDDFGIDYSDIPPLTDAQMATAIRGWRHLRARDRAKLKSSRHPIRTFNGDLVTYRRCVAR